MAAMTAEAARAQLAHLAALAGGRSGLEFLTHLASGAEPLPLGQHIGMRLAEVEAGRALFRLQPSPFLCNPVGGLHGGIFGLLLDSCMGCAVWTRCPAGSGYTTLEYKVNIVRGLNADAEEIVGEGRVLHFGRRTATAEGKILDAKGRLLAHGSTTCILLGDFAVPSSA
ncbi:MAG: PaaI family thioesterase [Rhodospirillales bacterium]